MRRIELEVCATHQRRLLPAPIWTRAGRDLTII
jgi:hypothetical protein